jgi:hypothetical protein
VFADVALPEVKEIHVVDCGLASLHLKQDARVVDTAEVIRAEGRYLVRHGSDSGDLT